MLKMTCLFAALTIQAAACSGGEPATAQSDVERYETQGTVRSVDEEGRRITIAHEDVPGYMPAMTMPFEVEDASLLQGLGEDVRVRFSFEPRPGGRHVIVSITRMTEN